MVVRFGTRVTALNVSLATTPDFRTGSKTMSPVSSIYLPIKRTPEI